MTIVKRADLGRPLTWDELDSNFAQVDSLVSEAAVAVSIATNQAEAASDFADTASQFSQSAQSAAAAASTSANAAAASAATAGGAAASAIGQTVRAPSGETLSALPAAASRQNQFIATDSSGNVTLVPRVSVPLLDGTGKLSVSVLPAIALTEPFVVSSQTAMLALDAQPGDIAKRTDKGYSFCLAALPASTLSNWIQLNDDILAQLAASSGAAAVGALDDSSAPTTVQNALNLKASIAKILGTGAGQGAKTIGMIQPFTGAVGRLQSDFNQQFVSVKDFFSSSDTSHDSAFAKAAMACISNNVGIRIPSGDYSLTQDWVINLITGKNLLILGDGSGVTRLFFRGSTNGISISAEVCQEWDAGSVIVKGISIITSNVNSGTALYINQNQVTGIPGGPIITEDLVIRGEITHTQQWGTGIVYNRVEGTITRDVGIYGYAQSSLGDGIEFRGTTDDVSTQHIMDNCRLWFLNRAVVANAYNQGIFYNCVNVFNCNYALDWDARAETYGQTELHVFNSQFSVHNAGFNISKIGYITAAGNMFIGATESTSPPTIFFRLNGCWEYSITTNNFVGGGHRNCIGFEIANDVPNASTANQSNYNGLIAMNTFDSMDVAILIESDSVSPHIRNNIYTISVTNTVVNNSSSPVVREDSVFKFTGSVSFATSNALQRVTVPVPAGLFRGTPDIAAIHWNGDYVIFGNFQVSESSSTSLVFTIRRYDGLAFNGGPFSYSVRASQ